MILKCDLCGKKFVWFEGIRRHIVGVHFYGDEKLWFRYLSGKVKII